MVRYKASRAVSGNRLFPAEVIIDESGVTIKLPGFFSGKEKTIPFSRISSVNIECPFVGYSTIIIETTGDGAIVAHGFLKSEVRDMKEMILSKVGESS